MHSLIDFEIAFCIERVNMVTGDRGNMRRVTYLTGKMQNGIILVGKCDGKCRGTPKASLHTFSHMFEDNPWGNMNTSCLRHLNIKMKFIRTKLFHNLFPEKIHFCSLTMN